MKRVKSSRWWHVFVVAALLFVPTIGLVTQSGVASALSGTFKIQSNVTFTNINTVTQTDTVTIGSKTYTANQQSCKQNFKNSENVSDTCTFETASITWNDSATPSIKACSAVLNNQCTTFKPSSGKSQTFTITGSTNNPGTATADTNNQSNSPECLNSGSGLSWFLCPVFQGVADASDWLFNSVIVPFLVTSPIDVSGGSSNPIYQVWSNFRIYGDIFLVIALLVMVFGEAIGGGVVDAYTVKKALPRLLAAAILVNLSVYIVAFMIDISNIVGKSISDIMIQPFKNAGDWHFTLSNQQSVGVFAVGILGLLISGGTIAGILVSFFHGKGTFAKVALQAALFTLIPIFLAILAVFFTLIIRKGIILVLILISPVAFAMYCLPGTEKYFKKWWDLLLETLMVYPIIMVIFATADILSITILNANGITPANLQNASSSTSLLTHGSTVAGLPHTTLAAFHSGVASFATLSPSALLAAPRALFGASLATNGSSQLLAIIVAFLLQFLPLLAIPFAFRMAGGTLSKMHEMVSAGHGKLGELTKGTAERKRHEFGTELMQGRHEAHTAINTFGDNHRWAKRIPIVGTNATARRVGGHNIDAAMSARNADVHKEMNDQISSGDDSKIRGLLVNKKWARDQGALSAVQDGGKNYMSNGQYRYEVDDQGNRTGPQEFKSLGGKWLNESAVDGGKAIWGGNMFAAQTALSYEMRKAQETEDVEGIEQNWGAAANGFGLTKTQRGSAWMGAAFENQQDKLAYKYSAYNDNGTENKEGFKYKGYTSEVYNGKGTYPLSQINGAHIKRLRESYRMAQRDGDGESQERLKAIANTLQDRYRQQGGGTNGTMPRDEEGNPVAATGPPADVQKEMDAFLAATRGNGGTP